MPDINHIIKKCESYLNEQNYIGLTEDKNLREIKKLDKSIIEKLYLYTQDKQIIEIITNYYNLEKFDFYKTLELNLLKLYNENKDKKIRNFICIMNKNLVINFATFYARNNNFEDLYQVGLIGLIKGIEKFDCNFSSKLSTYACYWIKKEIIDYLYNLNDTIRKPKYVGENTLKINKFVNTFYQNNGYYPSEEEIITSFSKNKIRAIQYNNNSQNNNNIFSLDEQLRTSSNDEENLDWYSIQGNEEEFISEMVENAERQTLLKKLIAYLSPNQQYIILNRYGFNNNEPKTFQEIGHDLNMSKQAVEQAEKRALAKLRIKIKEKKYQF